MLDRVRIIDRNGQLVYDSCDQLGCLVVRDLPQDFGKLVRLQDLRDGPLLQPKLKGDVARVGRLAVIEQRVSHHPAGVDQLMVARRSQRRIPFQVG